MITTFKEIVKSQGWQIGQMAETDFWMGVSYIRHINRVMLIESDKAYIESDKYIFADENPSAEISEAKQARIYDDNIQMVKAHTEAEALEDAKLMAKILDEQQQQRVEKIKNAMLKGIKTIQDGMGDYCYNDEAVQQLGKFQGDEFGKFRRMLHLAGYYENLDYISEEAVQHMQKIYHQHGFCWQDDDNDQIQTWINLDNAISVKTDCLCGGKNCVHITMPGDKAFNIYKKKDKDLYTALEALYGEV